MNKQSSPDSSGGQEGKLPVLVLPRTQRGRDLLTQVRDVGMEQPSQSLGKPRKSLGEIGKGLLKELGRAGKVILPPLSSGRPGSTAMGKVPGVLREKEFKGGELMRPGHPTWV